MNAAKAGEYEKYRGKYGCYRKNRVFWKAAGGKAKQIQRNLM